MNNVQVKHRNGNVTGLDITKIREVIQWACKDIKNVSPTELEAVFNTRLKDNITTSEIQNNLIVNCLELCIPERSNYRYVAGRLRLWSLWKDIKVARKIDDIKNIYQTSAEGIIDKLQKGIYNPILSEYYTNLELEDICKWMYSTLDEDYDYAGISLLISRYLLPNELPQEMFLINALILSQGNIFLARKIYKAIAERKISLATPMLANLRIPLGSVTSCFILNVEDNLTHIFKVISDCAEVSKQGGGLGVCLSKIRAKGSWVRGKINTSGGIIPWIKILNDTALAVNQGGRRAGAITVAVDIWHLDVPEFLEMQTEHGDQRRKAFDVFPQLVISDEFMRRVTNNEEWTLVDPYEVKEVFGYDLATLWGKEFLKAYKVIESEILGDCNLFDSSVNGQQNREPRLKLYKRVNAKELFKQIMKNQLDTGLPYLAFKDTINEANPNKHLGYIPCVNLCTESFSNVSIDESHACDLVSLNLANIEDSELEKITTIAVTILDNSLDIAQPPIETAQKHHDKYRVIGVGAMGLADWLAKRQFSYTNNQEKIDNLFEDISYYAYKASIDLAKNRGTYDAYDGSDWSKGLINNHSQKWYKTESYKVGRWLKLFEDLQQYGIRNSQVLAIAPNTSSSLIQGCTASILPTFNRFFYDNAAGSYPIAPAFIDEYFWFYEENKHLNQNIVINTVAAIQKWVDTGISMELLFDLDNVSKKEIYDTLINAWRQKVKAIYYIRAFKKQTLKSDKVECSTCSN
jgi:ribonucleoside-diphosphate reductase alpha chain